jgi:Gametolysin peptidase M11
MKRNARQRAVHEQKTIDSMLSGSFCLLILVIATLSTTSCCTARQLEEVAALRGIQRNDQLHFRSDLASSTDRRTLETSRGSAGSLRVLMIRIATTEATVSVSAAHLDSLLFRDAAAAHQVTLASQLEACSGGQLQLEPTLHRVLDIQLSLTGGDRNVLVAAAEPLALAIVLEHQHEDPFFASRPAKDFTLRDYADLLMFVVPPPSIAADASAASSGGGAWLGRGVVNGKQTIFNNVYGSYLAVQAHEIGHNFNLKHAGRPGLGYVQKKRMGAARSSIVSVSRFDAHAYFFLVTMLTTATTCPAWFRAITMWNVAH